MTMVAALALVLAVAAVCLPAKADAAPPCTIVGKPGPDRLTGTPLADVICGRGGADRINGLGGNDRLLGGAGADRLSGGPGNDVLIGGPGADRLLGGPGANSCRDTSIAAATGCGAPRPARPRPPTRLPYLAAPPSPPLTGSPYGNDVIDVTAPDLVSLSLSTENVEIANGDWWLDLSVTSMDATAVASVVVAIEGPQGPWREVSFTPFGTPDEQRRRIEVPASTPTGEYRVSAVTLVDSDGYSVTRDGAWLEEWGLDARFEVYDGPDREAPNLTDISFEPSPADTSNGPVTLQVSIEATDAGGGVEGVRLRVAHPTSTRGGERVYVPDLTLVSGSERDGTWRGEIELPSGATAGFYPVDELELADHDHHRQLFNSETLENHDFPGGFSQVGAADKTKPQITSFSISPQVLHTATGERSFDVDIGVSDTWSGVTAFWDPVSSVRFWLTPPDWPISWGMGGSEPQLIAGDEHAGIWRLPRQLEADASIGTWTVRWIEVTDRAGNTTRLEDASLEDFEAEGWDLSFENLPAD